MKFLCVTCDRAMKLDRTLGPDQGSMTVVFVCPGCEHEREVHASGAEQDEPYYEDEEYFYFSPFSEWLSAETAKHRLGMLRRYVKPGPILEIGPGSGKVVSAAEKAGFAVSAVEGSEVFVRHLRSHTGAQVFHGLFENVDLADDEFEAVLSFHVIEHLPDPESHLNRLRKVLRPGGFLLLATPNATSWDRRMFGARWTG